MYNLLCNIIRRHFFFKFGHKLKSKYCIVHMFNYAEMAQFWGQLCTVCIEEFVSKGKKLFFKLLML